MRYAVFAVFLAAAVGLIADTEWLDFKTLYNKVYDSDAEEAYRYEVFLDNKAVAEHYNKIDPTAEYGITMFSDLSQKEFAATYLRAFPPIDTTEVEMPAALINLPSIPDKFDWRHNGTVVAVKDQGQCGSCWAFSAVGTIEGAWKVAGNALTSFSEQQIVDCDSPPNQGCQGGWMDKAIDYVITNGIEKESDYPYHAKQATCQFDKSKVAGKITSRIPVKGTEDEMANQLVQNAPLSIGVDATKFQTYRSGIMSGTGCRSDPNGMNHGVLITGYWLGKEQQKPYWVIKNSWGAGWGLQGYIHLARGINACGCTNMVNIAKA